MRGSLASVAGAIAATICAGGTAPVFAMDPAVPTALAPPRGTTLIERLAGTGSQIYVCAPHAVAAEGAATRDAGYAWTLKAPDAILKDADGTPVIRHFAGPTWQAKDGSRVVGKLIAQQQAPAKGAVPWLLLSATETGVGHLAGTRYVQRLDTAGGVAPAGPCTTVGAERRVPYAAQYAFYR